VSTVTQSALEYRQDKIAVKSPPVGYPVLLALAALAGGLYAYGRLHAPAAPRAVTAAPAARAPAAQQAPEPPAPAQATIPAEVPDVQLPDLAGKPHSLREGVGHQRLFNFWATWCEPCRREIPLLNALQAAHATEGLQVVGIAIDLREAVLKFQQRTPLHYKLLVGEDEGFEAAQKFGMELGLPFTVFADADNRVIAVKVGELHADEAAAILANMRALRAGTTTLEVARDNIATALRSLAVERSKQSAEK
jgi:thiol-disulfide isomerase/thioredoxin